MDKSSAEEGWDFHRLTISFLILLMASALFITFFSFYKYSDEINLNLNRYVSLLVQNVELKVRDIMQIYEEIAHMQKQVGLSTAACSELHPKS